MQFSWIAFYEQIADKLAAYALTNAEGFVCKGQGSRAAQPLMHYLHFENSGEWQARDNEIDPFTVMGVFQSRGNSRTPPRGPGRMHCRHAWRKFGAAQSLSRHSPSRPAQIDLRGQ